MISLYLSDVYLLVKLQDRWNFRGVLPVCEGRFKPYFSALCGLSSPLTALIIPFINNPNYSLLVLFIQPIQLLGYQIELIKPGRVPAGRSEWSFEFPLRARNTKTLFETYHGVFINIQYNLKCEIKKSFLVGTTLSKTTEFIVEYGGSNSSVSVTTFPSASVSPPTALLATELLKPAEMKRVDFEMITEAGSKLGFFKAHGHIDSSNCPITKPFTGEIIIDKSEFPIKSVEIQLGKQYIPQNKRIIIILLINSIIYYTLSNSNSKLLIF